VRKGKKPVNSGVLVLRRRCGWEACDSGVLLWRRNFLPLFLFSGVPVLALAAALGFVNAAPLFVPCLILWWLKPLWDRLILHVISIRFFEPESSLRRLFSGLWRTLLRGLPGDLLWRRFSPWRAARLAVRVLETEKSAGKNLRRSYRQRISSLAGGGLGFCVFLTTFGIVLEFVTLAGEAGFCFLMQRIFDPSLDMELTELAGRFSLFFAALYGINLALLEGLYMCMGFGLYIRSRVEVEGWDIQLLLQKAASSAASRAAKKSVSGILLVLALLCVFSAPEVFGEEESALVPLEELKEVLASPDFGRWRETWRIRIKQDAESGERPGESFDFSKLAARNARIRELLARTLRFVLIAATAGFAVFSAYRLFRMEQSRRAGKTGRFYAQPSPDNPGELLRGARDLYGRGNIREAWALCFRGARAAYGVAKGLAFPPDATPYNCLSLVREAGCDISDGFARLVRSWVYCAYAGRFPPGDAFEEALDFCHSLLGEEKAGA
jgi:hypothetical protein